MPMSDPSRFATYLCSCSLSVLVQNTEDPLRVCEQIPQSRLCESIFEEVKQLRPQVWGLPLIGGLREPEMLTRGI